jgi:hypothetical protein
MYQRAQEQAAASGAQDNGAGAEGAAGAEEDVVDAEVVDEPKA